MDGANLNDGHIEEIPFGAARTDGRDFVPALDSQLHQAIANVVNGGNVLVDAVVTPRTVFLSVQCIVTLKVDGIVRKDVKNASNFHYGSRLFDDQLFG